MDCCRDAVLAWAYRYCHRMDYFLDEGPLALDSVSTLVSPMVPLWGYLQSRTLRSPLKTLMLVTELL